MKPFKKSLFTLTLFAAATAGSASAVTLPVTESFDTDDADWQAGGGAATYVSTGGSDGGGYISSTIDFSTASADDPVTLFRGQALDDSSGDAFVGNWIAAGVTTYSMDIRHNHSTPLTFFTRFAGQGNFPGGVGLSFVPVLPNTWTKLTIAIDAGNPSFIYEGAASNHNSVFGALGNIQPGISAPAGLAGTSTQITFDLDQVTITPEPGSLALLGLGGLALLGRRSGAVRAGR